jgi:hypothetical protein
MLIYAMLYKIPVYGLDVMSEILLAIVSCINKISTALNNDIMSLSRLLSREED